jgi:hypothetical protein
MDATNLEDNPMYEQQINAQTGQYRHRFGYPDILRIGCEGYGEWKDGSAPN